MRESADLDDLDLLLVTALQTAPRATWQQLGQVLGVTASTAARRWERLTGAGLAWLSCHPLRLPGISAVLAVIGINCVAVRLPSVAATVAEDPHVFNVSHVTGFYDLVVIAAFADQISLGRYLRFRVGSLDGVQSVRVHIVTDLHTEGSQWRLDRLEAAHRAALLADRPAARRTPNVVPDAADLVLMTALRDNPRQSAADLARSTRLSTTSVRRRLIRLDAARLMAWRCDVARGASGWPVAASFWGVAPPDRAAEISGQVSRLRETRFCASLSGRTTCCSRSGSAPWPTSNPSRSSSPNKFRTSPSPPAT
jgi:DNA-binding Lrp family transcriptional regulator